MSINKLKKILFILIIGIIVLGNIDANAEDKQWPSYGSCNSKIMDIVKDKDYCVYSGIHVVKFSGSDWNKHQEPSIVYSEKEYIFFRDGSNNLRLLNANSGCGSSSGDTSIGSDEAWDKSGINQYIHFSPSLLTDGSGNLNCSNICLWSTSGDLFVDTSSNFQEVLASHSSNYYASSSCSTGRLVKASSTTEQVEECSSDDQAAIEREYVTIKQNFDNRLTSIYNGISSAYHSSYSQGHDALFDGLDSMESELNSIIGEDGEIRKLYAKYGCSDLNYKSKIDDMKTLYNRWIRSIKSYGEQQIKADKSLTEEQRKELLERLGVAYQESTQYGETVFQSFLDFMGTYVITPVGDTDSCEGILGDSLMSLIKKYLGWIRIIAPILVIVLSAVDFGKAVLSDDQKALSKAFSNLIKRMIIVVAIIFIPYLLMYLIDFASKYSKHISTGCDLRGW